MIETNKIHNMDCLEGLKQIDDNSIDVIITDPPYGIEYKSNHYKWNNPHKEIINDDTFFFPIEELWRVLKPSGAIFCFFSHKIPLVDKRLKNTIIWVKNNWTAGDLEGDFGNQYECLGFLPKESFKIKGKRFSNVWHFNRIPSHKLKHPTEKPLDLIMRIVQCSSNKGDLVLDPFMGSGTTAVASKQLERSFIGFELRKEYCDKAQERLSQQTMQSFVS